MKVVTHWQSLRKMMRVVAHWQSSRKMMKVWHTDSLQERWWECGTLTERWWEWWHTDRKMMRVVAHWQSQERWWECGTLTERWWECGTLTVSRKMMRMWHTDSLKERRWWEWWHTDSLQERWWAKKNHSIGSGQQGGHHLEGAILQEYDYAWCSVWIWSKALAAGAAPRNVLNVTMITKARGNMHVYMYIHTM